VSVDRCVCHAILFRDLIDLACKTGQDFRALQEATGCGTRCGMCAPYAQVALKTGKHRLPVMSDEQFEEALGEEWREQTYRNTPQSQ
jgi:bacterioferritin-associated ferredoxin